MIKLNVTYCIYILLNMLYYMFTAASFSAPAFLNIDLNIKYTSLLISDLDLLTFLSHKHCKHHPVSLSKLLLNTTVQVQRWAGALPSPPPPPRRLCAGDTGRWSDPSSSGCCYRPSGPQWRCASCTSSKPTEHHPQMSTRAAVP